MSEPKKEPEIDALKYSLGELHTALITGKIQCPVWLRVANARHRVTMENKHDFCRGLLLASEMMTL